MLGRMLVLIWVLQLLACSTVPIPTDTDTLGTALEWVDIDEITTLKSVVAYGIDLHQLSDEQRLLEFEQINAIEQAQPLSLLERLRLAQLVGGVDAQLADYERAQKELQNAFEQLAAKPLLMGYIQVQLTLLEQLSGLSSVNKKLRIRNSQLKKELGESTEKALVETVEAEAEATANLSRTEDTFEAFQQAQLVGLQRAYEQLSIELQTVRTTLAQRDTLIAEQEEQIAALEAKIKALSAIERSINNQRIQTP